MRLLILFIFFMTVQSLYAEKCTYLFYDDKAIIEKTIEANDEFGCEYENRDITKYQNKVTLSLGKNDEERADRLLEVLSDDKFVLFDVFPFSDPTTEKVREVVIFENKNLLVLLHGYNAYISGRKDTVEVDASFYKISLYKLYDGFPLKIKLDMKEFTGIDGFYHGKYLKYKYKKKEALQKELNKFSPDKNKIISSLELFLLTIYKSDEITQKKYRVNSINISFLGKFIDDIEINKRTVEAYNNIGYYLQKLGNNEEAIYLLKKVIDRSPDRIVAYYNLADAYWEIKNTQKSVTLYKKYH